MSGKLSRNLSIDELIQIANSISSDPNEEEGLNHVESFIMSNNVMIGPDKILPSIIWLKYLEWCEEQQDKAIGRKKFWKLFNVHFKQQRNMKMRYYLLNKEVFNLSDENKKKLTVIRQQHRYTK